MTSIATTQVTTHVGQTTPGKMFGNLTASSFQGEKTPRMYLSDADKTKIFQFCAVHGLSKRAWDADLVMLLITQLGWHTPDTEVYVGLVERLVRFIEREVCAEKLPMAIKAQPLTDAKRCVAFKVTWAAHTVTWNNAEFKHTMANNAPPQGPPDFEHGRQFNRPWVGTNTLIEAIGELHASQHDIVGSIVPATGPAIQLQQIQVIPMLAAVSAIQHPQGQPNAGQQGTHANIVLPAAAAAQLPHTQVGTTPAATPATQLPQSQSPANQQGGVCHTPTAISASQQLPVLTLYKMPKHIDALLAELTCVSCNKDGSPVSKAEFIAWMVNPKARAKLVDRVRAGSNTTSSSRDAALTKALKEKSDAETRATMLQDNLEKCLLGAEEEKAEAEAQATMLRDDVKTCLQSAEKAELKVVEANSRAAIAEGKAKRLEEAVQEMHRSKLQAETNLAIAEMKVKSLEEEMQKLQEKHDAAESRATILTHTLQAVQAAEGSEDDVTGTVQFATDDSEDPADSGRGDDGSAEVTDKDDSPISEERRRKLELIKQRLRSGKKPHRRQQSMRNKHEHEDTDSI
ncbi:hypothetical protein Tdes44962_MAKER03152 [Teratosphaeria destructans]|uniref:Uncharacterized protein n=1 Tax=Teratosphaeria destructans TaxID=418781 RepID=A0A9W7SQW0_9PEZI|nr:hypothetical protein Tdes44962_MAKER03152 [Teratosphaeria destructans]